VTDADDGIGIAAEDNRCFFHIVPASCK
jgi:hypothetical protein